MNNLLFILLDSMADASWFGILLAAVVGVLAYLLKSEHIQLKKQAEENEKELKRIEDKNDIAISSLNNKLHEYQLKILEKLSDIKSDFRGLRD